jgi:hypothetical protein
MCMFTFTLRMYSHMFYTRANTHINTHPCIHRLPRQVLNVAWAMHELVGDHADEALAWLEERHERAAGNRLGE